MHRQIDGDDPRRIGAHARRIGIRGAVAVSAATGLLAAACGGSGHSPTTPTTVNPARVEAAIAASVHGKRHVDSSVTCPTGVPLRRRETFYCIAQVGGQVTPFHVTETSASGHVTFVGVNPNTTHLLGTTQVAKAIVASIKSTRGIAAVVRCPADIPMQRGLPFACTATTHSGATHFEVRQTDGHGHVSYHSL